MVGVEAPEEVLLGLAAALVLAQHEAGDQAEDVGRPSPGQELEALPGNQELGRRRLGWRGRHHDGREDRRCRGWLGRLLRPRARSGEHHEGGDRPGASAHRPAASIPGALLSMRSVSMSLSTVRGWKNVDV